MKFLRVTNREAGTLLYLDPYSVTELRQLQPYGPGTEVTMNDGTIREVSEDAETVAKAIEELSD